MSRRAIILVLDGVGIGEAPDAALYGDVGSGTLGSIARAVGRLHLPNFHLARPTFDRGLLLANLVDFDQPWGHRNDVVGFYTGLRAFDHALPSRVCR
jgi:phosphopentomutase